MDCSSTTIVENSLFSLFNEIKMIKSIKSKHQNKKQTSKIKKYVGKHRYQESACESQQCLNL